MRCNPKFGAPSWTVVVWLRSLSLGKYEPVFRKRGIDQLVLPNLAQEQLKEINVGPVV